MFRRALLLLIGTFAAVASAGGVVWAEPVTVRGGPHAGFGRIVFEWPSPVTYSTTPGDGTVEVRFGRPIEADYSSLLRVLRKYVRRATARADGQSVVFELKRPVDIRSFDLGRSVIVDLLDTATKRKTKSDRATREPRITVRAGEHEGYSRLVFDWPSRVPYGVAEDDGGATVTFDRAQSLDLTAARRHGLRRLRGISSAVKDDAISVRLLLPPGARIRHFHSGPKVVIDILDPGLPVTADAGAGKPVAEPKPKPMAQKTPEKPKPAPMARAVPQEPEAAPKAPQVSPRAEPAPPPEPPAELPTGPPPPVLATPSLPIPLTPEKGTSEGPDVAQVPSEGEIPDASVMAPAAGPMPRPAPVAAGPKKEPAPAPAGALDSAMVRFDWDEPVGAVVFRRAGKLWIAFDKQTDVDIAALSTMLGKAVREIRPVQALDATVLVMDTLSGVNPALRREGLSWLLDFKRQRLRANTKIEPKSQPNSPLGPRLFLPVPEPGRAIAVTDPEVGDNLVIVPVIPLGHGMTEPHDFPQFRLPATGQGIVVEPLADGLRVRSLRQGIEITRSGDLFVSQVDAKKLAEQKVVATRPLSRVLDPDIWLDANLETFTEKRQALQRALASAEPGARDGARMDLARHYFIHLFAPETLSVLQRLEDEESVATKTPEFRIMRGVANFLAGREKEALEAFSHPSLDRFDEAVFWRAVTQAKQGHPERAAARLKETAGIPRPYAKNLQFPLNLQMVSAALAVGDANHAADHIGALKLGDNTEGENARIGFLEGGLQELNGEFEKAVLTWEEVAERPHRLSRARAEYARTDLLAKREQIPPAEALEQFERLRYAWRGDEFEFQLLHRLGQLYLESGDYRNGLRTLRQAATHFRDHPLAAEVAQTMVNVFNRLFLEDEADRLAPVSAIALYDEFKELTPSGAEGDEMIRKLADRLAAVDLLDRAASLLDKQVKFRLKGADKARVGAQLALVRILNKEPDRAAETLAKTEIPGLPAQLATQRRHLRARALATLGREAEALELLEDDVSSDAELLRGEIAWQLRDWKGVADSLRTQMSELGIKPGAELSDAQSKMVLNLAVVSMLSGNERAVARLRRDHGVAMEATPVREAFRLIAKPAESGLIDFRAIEGRVADARDFQAFLSKYKERLGNGQLSAIN